MAKSAKYILLTLGVILALGGIYLYTQYEKLKDYCISVKRIKLNKFVKNQADIDLILLFKNKSSLNITLYSQEYQVFMNDVFLTKVSNSVPQTIKANASSDLAVKFQFNPQDAIKIAAANIVDILTEPGNVKIMISTKITLGLKGLKFNINYDYPTTLKELMSSDKPNKSAEKC